MTPAQDDPNFECGDMSPLSDWQTCLPVQSAVMPAHSKLGHDFAQMTHLTHLTSH
jgi:hypothetical protein